jgi:NADPH-dependent 2,4-dienoyl-CoA reductase/sulfur reductase-like enzyme
MSEALEPSERVTIVGASLAGLRCAETLRREGFVGSITMVGDELHAPYDRPPLSKQVLSGAWPIEKVTLADQDKLDELGISTRLGVPATGLDSTTRTVVLADGTSVHGDAVVVATGCSLRRLPGTETLSGVHGLRSLDDALRLRDALRALEPESRVVLVGAGFIGQEVATAALAAGHHVTILEGLELPLLPIVGVQVAELLVQMARSSGAALVTGAEVTGIDGPRDGAQAGWVALEGSESLPADLIVVGIGVIPATGWLADSGLRIDNGVVTDQQLFAGPGVVAAGDVARFHWHGAGHDELVRIEHWQMAADQGMHAARSLLAGSNRAQAFSAVPYFWSDQWGKKIQVLGHPSQSDEVEVLIPPDEEGRFLTIYHCEGLFTGVLAVSKPRQLMAFRPLLTKASSTAEALAVEL